MSVGDRITHSESLVANVLPVQFAFESFAAWSRLINEGEDLSATRASLRNDWFVYWDAGALYLLPVNAGAKAPAGMQPVELNVNAHLRLLARLVTDSLIRRFPDYEPLRVKPFTFLGRRNQLLERAAKTLQLKHKLLHEFRIWPKYQLDARVLQTHAHEPFVGVTIDVSTRWEVAADLTALADAGVDLVGFYVVRRVQDPDGRRLVGRIASIRDGCVRLSDSTDGIETIDATAAMLEGRRDTFATCLSTLLGQSDYRRFAEFQETQIAGLLSGRPLLAEVRRVGELLARSPMELSSGLTCSTGQPFSLRNRPDYLTVVSARRLDYCFDPARSKRHRYAWPGLDAYGPFSRETFARPSPTILVVCPTSAQGAVESFVRRLRDGIPEEPAYQAGMTKTFGLINPRFEFVLVKPGQGTPAERYREAVANALSRDELPDAALVIVIDAEGDLPDHANPYLHSKATLLMAGVATQEVRLSTATRPPQSLAYILQNVSLALYAKMKGVPWTVDHDLSIADELVIGIGTAELSESRLSHRHRYVGITTVFRGDGNYLLGQLSREADYADYPAVLRDSTRAVIEEIKQRNGWQRGDTVRIIFHAAHPPRNVDFARLMREVADTVGMEQHVECAFVTVTHDHPFVIFDTSQNGKSTPRGRKGEMTPDRGLIVQTSPFSRLITTTGLSLVKRADLPLSKPLQVHVHRESTFTDLHYLAEQVLKFTGLSWRSTTPAADPVTIYYSELIARLLGRLKAVPDWSPALLDVRLRSSKWFL
jgi:hypothetical protein